METLVLRGHEGQRLLPGVAVEGVLLQELLGVVAVAHGGGLLLQQLLLLHQGAGLVGPWGLQRSALARLHQVVRLQNLEDRWLVSGSVFGVNR